MSYDVSLWISLMLQEQLPWLAVKVCLVQCALAVERFVFWMWKAGSKVLSILWWAAIPMDCVCTVCSTRQLHSKSGGQGTGLLVCGHSVPLAYCKARKNSRIIPSACIWPYTPARSRASLSALLRLEFCSTFRSCCLLRRWEPQSCG